VTVVHRTRARSGGQERWQWVTSLARAAGTRPGERTP
jgi:hypothetical protein